MAHICLLCGQLAPCLERVKMTGREYRRVWKKMAWTPEELQAFFDDAKMTAERKREILYTVSPWYRRFLTRLRFLFGKCDQFGGCP